MLTLSAPAQLDGQLLAEQLTTAGLATSPRAIRLNGDNLDLIDLAETDRAAAQKVVDAHATTAQARKVQYDGEQANETTLRTQAENALAGNRTFLALSSPTNAQTLAQVKALTRQNNGIIRLLLRKLDGTD